MLTPLQRLFATSVLLLGASAACGSTTAPTAPSSAPTALTAGAAPAGTSTGPTASAVPASSAPAPLGDPETLTITLVPAPSTLSIDGKLDEWGARAPGDGPSWIRVALRESGAVIAAELRGDARKGVRFGIRFGQRSAAPDEQPGAAIESSRCKVTTESTTPFQPKQTPVWDGCMVTQSLCHDPIGGFAERFAKEFVIDADGVRPVAHDSSTRTQLPGFKATQADSVTRVEGLVPASELPLVAADPTERVALAVALGASTEQLPFSAWGWRDTAVSFAGIDAALKAQFARVADSSIVSAGLQPGTDEVLTLGCAEGWYLLLQRRAGFVSLAKMGDVELGALFDPTIGIATRKAGVVVQTVETGFTEQPKFAVRGDRLWVAGVHDGERTQLRVPQYSPRFTVLAIDRDGQIREIGLEQYHVAFWYKVSPSFAADLSTLTLSGEVDAIRGGGADVVTWRYDDASDTYKITRHDRGDVDAVDTSTLRHGTP